jgi:bacteriorhodopsin
VLGLQMSRITAKASGESYIRWGYFMISCSALTMTVSYLQKLNPQQRSAALSCRSEMSIVTASFGG